MQRPRRRRNPVIFEAMESRTLFSVPALGVNIRRLGLGAGDQLFADAMKATGNWSTNLAAPNKNEQAPIDANGWPMTDAGIEVIQGTISDTADYGGTYALSFTGQATVSPVPSQSFVQVASTTYDSASNTTTAEVVVAPGSHDLMLDFTNTRRLPTDTTATGITDVQLMRPDGVDSSTSYSPSTIFSTPILNLLSNFSALRFMDYSLTNFNPQVNWSDRTLPAQEQVNGKGGAWEYAVALGNATNEDIWLNIPEMATDAYITNLAQLIDFGSDGVNPYTGPIGSSVSAANPNPVPSTGPVWAGLNPNLHVYLEYSNEVWNTVFSQSLQNLQAARAEVSAGNSPLNYDGDTSEFDWSVRRTAERTVETSEIFRSVFGDSQMSEIRPVYDWQYNNLNATAAIGLQFVNNYYNNADGVQHVLDPHPVDYFIWGGGGGWYGKLSNVNGTGDVTIAGSTFAAPVVSGFAADPSGSSWAFSGSAGIAANGSALGNPPATSGSQAAYIQGTGSFSETVNFTGGLADLAFGVASTGSETLKVLVDGKDVSFTTPSANTPWVFTSAYSTFRTAVIDTGISAGPHTVTFTGIAGSGNLFVSNIVAETVNGMYNSTIQDISSTTRSESSWAAAFGLHTVGYEGGFTFGSGYTGTDLQIAANLDPRAEQADIAQMDEFYASGGDLAMYYQTTNYIAALTLDINVQDTAKIRAVQAVVAAPKPALNFGAVMPTAGHSVTVANTLVKYGGAAGLYPLNVTAAGTYHVTLSGLQSGAVVEQFLLDGQVVPGLTALPTGTSGNSTPAITFTVTTPGQHSLLLVTRGPGTISPTNPAGSITITAGAGPVLPAVPNSPTNLGTLVANLTRVNLSWTASAGASGYQIQRSTDGVNFRIISATSSSSFGDTTAASGATYIYRVVPYNGGGFGAGATFAPVTVINPPKHLVFTTPPPASITAGSSIGSTTGIKVAVEYGDGSTIGADASTVTLTLHGGTFASGATTASAAAVSGVATFKNLVINSSGVGYTLTASDGGVTPATSAAFNVIPGTITAKAVAFHATQGRSATGTVATFSVPGLTAAATDFTATLTWGDTTQSFPGTIVQDSAGKFHVTATHVYSKLSPSAGFAIKVTIKETGGLSANTTSTGTVTAATLAAISLAAITTPVNMTLTSKVIASFQDNNPLQTLASTYAGTINWGDGTSSTTATFKFSSSKTGVASFWNVLGTHKYTKKGTFTITAAIHETAASVTVTLKTVVHVV